MTLSRASLVKSLVISTVRWGARQAESKTFLNATIDSPLELEVNRIIARRHAAGANDDRRP
jgi:hypothetical protein